VTVYLTYKKMEYNAICIALAQEGLPLLDYTIQFSTWSSLYSFDAGLNYGCITCIVDAM